MKYTPPTFETIQELKAMTTFKRKPHIEEAYHIKTEYIRNVMKQTPEKYIRERVCKNRQGITFCRNSYPYWVEDGINHYLIWYLSNSGETITAWRAKNFLKDYKKEFVIFSNQAKNKSVKEIQHFHIFTKLNLDHLINNKSAYEQ